MQIKPLSIFIALRGSARALLFQPNDNDAAHSPEIGLARLHLIAQYQPVYLVRLEGNRPVRVLRNVPFDQLSLPRCCLVPRHTPLRFRRMVTPA